MPRQNQLTDVVRALVYHSAGSKTLQKMPRASSSTTPTLSPSPLASSSPSITTPSQPSHTFPDDRSRVHGVQFNIDFQRVYYNGSRLNAHRLGYRVRHKSALGGRRESAAFWSYGIELQYQEAGRTSRFWLCKACHEAGSTPDAFLINGTAHITAHLLRQHRIDPKTGLLPDNPTTPKDPWEAARIAGSSTYTAHTPWEEDKLQAALVDWAIVHDISFTTATSTTTRGLLTWNRQDLLRALPQSPTTLSTYVTSSFQERRTEISKILEAARSKISVSVDVWTSRNHYSFLAVVAHFVG